MKYLFLFFILAISGSAHSQIITTIAGNDTVGFSGDGGPATTAKLHTPHFAQPDGSGNVYIADESNYRIRKVNTAGIITTIACTGGSYCCDGMPATAAGKGAPSSLAIDLNGNIYITATGTSGVPIVRKIDTVGIISTIAGGGTGGDGSPATAASLSGASDVAVDRIGNIYICEPLGYIRKVNSAGIISTIAGNGTLGFSGDGGSATDAQFHQPEGIAVDDSGKVYIADLGNFRIRRVDATGNITTIAGTGTVGYIGDGGAATAAELYGPYGVAVDKLGNVYIADAASHHVRKITDGIITTFAGDSISGHTGDGGPATSAEFKNPYSVSVDNIGNIYITDIGNNDIRKVPHVHNVATQQLTAKSDWNIYPNPAKDLITIYTSVALGAMYEITDMPGRSLLKGNMSGGTQTIDVKSLSPGTYIISLYDGDKRDYSKVFIKQ